MVKGACLNGTMVNTDYSFPVPLVGAYIAVASMVCFFLVLCDVWCGFRSKQYWFPCRFFSINSVTLTLISVAAKIPVDLTSTMPSKQDQLSKLSGTVFICVTMCFMLPSIATNAEFESYANVIALSIFVVIVVVNVCIQMATGVIFSFIVEHAIIMICMLLLLMRFWISVTSINVYKNEVRKKMERDNGEYNMLARLKLCYFHSYQSCPQWYLCRSPMLGDVASICWVYLVVLVEAMLRSFISKELRFCHGISDYGWSMWLVLVSQCLTLAIGIFAIGGRCLSNIAHFEDSMRLELPGVDGTYLQFQYLFAIRNIPSFLEKSFRFLIFLPLYMVNLVWTMFHVLVYFFFYLVSRCQYGIFHREDTGHEDVMAFQNQLSQSNIVRDDWVSRKAVANMKRWIETNVKSTVIYLNNLLSTVAPSEGSSYTIGPDGNGINSLSIVLLEEIANLVVMPSDGDRVSLSKVLDEVFEIILFIDNKLNTGNSVDRSQLMLAKVIHQYGLTSGLMGYALERKTQGNFDFVKKSECFLCETLDRYLYQETRRVSDFIGCRPQESSEVVCGS